MDRVFGLAHRNRRVVGDAARGLDDLVAQFVGRAEPVDHAPLIGVLGRKRPTGQDDLFGAPLADSARQVLRTAGAGHDTERRFGQREAGGFGRIDKVATQRQLTAAGVRGAVDRPQHRNRTADKSPDHALEEEMLGLPGFVRHALAFLEIAAGAKRLVAGPGQHNATMRQRVGVDAVEKRQQIAAHLGVHRIGDIRPAERDDGQATALVLDANGFVVSGHRCQLPCRRSSLYSTRHDREHRQ